jgi:hypothetical protein
MNVVAPANISSSSTTKAAVVGLSTCASIIVINQK